MTQLHDDSEEVTLNGSSAAQVLRNVLLGARAEFPELAAPSLESDSTFRKHYGAGLPVIDLARRTSEKRARISLRLTELLQGHVRYRGLLLEEALSSPAPAYEVRTCMGRSTDEPVLTLDGQTYPKRDWSLLGKLLERTGRLNAHGAVTLEAGLRVAESNVSQQSFVILGAAAELAPTRELMRLGARVLWVDLKPPDADELPDGRPVFFAPEGMDLLKAPERVLATIQAFARGEPVHVGCYAYAPGRARELRLMVAMNAIVESLSDGELQSVSLLHSPAAPNPVSPEDASRGSRRRQNLLFRASPPYVESSSSGPGSVRVSTHIVPSQGLSYQAAQYLGKSVWLEALRAKRPGLRCGAAMAGISRTESLNHPAFQLAFSMARSQGVDIYEPEFCRQLCALMMLGRLQTDFTFDEPQLHGGVHQLPYTLNHALYRALLRALVHRPWQAAALFR